MDDERALRAKLRTTGNATLVAFFAPIALRANGSHRLGWRVYVGAHLVHMRYLVAAARSRRGFSATSRYGGLAGYATIALLGLTGYSPGGPPPADRRVRLLHRNGERALFGLYGFTIVHGYHAKGRRGAVYFPLAALWLTAAVRGRMRWE